MSEKFEQPQEQTQSSSPEIEFKGSNILYHPSLKESDFEDVELNQKNLLNEIDHLLSSTDNEDCKNALTIVKELVDSGLSKLRHGDTPDEHIKINGFLDHVRNYHLKNLKRILLGSMDMIADRKTLVEHWKKSFGVK